MIKTVIYNDYIHISDNFGNATFNVGEDDIKITKESDDAVIFFDSLEDLELYNKALTKFINAVKKDQKK